MATDLKYFMFVEGVDGGSTDRDHRGWFEIDGYGLEVLNTVTLGGAGGGATAGMPTFSPLDIALGVNDSLAALFKAAASGLHFANVKIEGVTGGERPETIFGIALQDAILTRFGENSSQNDGLTFEYSQITVGSRTQGIDGRLGPWEATGYDRERATTNTDAAPLETNPTVVSDGASGQPAKYFMFIEGVDGGSADRDHRGWFEIDGYGLEVLNTVTLGGSGGATAGRPAFSPLDIALGINDSLAALFKAAASGLHFANVKIEGVNAGARPETIFGIALQDAILTRFDENSTQGDRLTFEYSQITVGSRTQGIDGRLGPWEATGYDRERGTTNTDATPLETRPTVASDGASGQPAQYFMFIEGVDGGSTDRDHRGWFEIDGYGLEVLNTVTLGGAGGATAGRPAFSPLDIALGINDSLAALFKAAASGLHFANVKIEGVNAGARPETIFGIALQDAILTRFGENSSQNDGLTFEYSQITVGSRTQGIDGRLGPWEATGYDRERATTNTDAAPLETNPTVVSDGASGQPAKYFMFIEGVDGGSADRDHRGWFEIDGYGLEVLNTVTLGGSGGATAGRPAFSPLDIALGINDSLAALFKAAASGLHFANVKIEGVNAGARPETIFGIALQDAILTRFDENSTQGDRLTFEYSQITVGSRTQGIDGRLGPWEATGYDRERGSTNTDATPLETRPSVVSDGASGQPANYFMFIEGLDGGSTDAEHRGWFEIDGYGLEILNTVTLGGAGGGATAGRPAFSPLDIALGINDSLAALFKAAASGLHFANVKIEGVTDPGSTRRPETIFGIALQDAILTRFDENSTQSDGLTFEYSEITVGSRTQGIDGRLGPWEATGYDRERATTNTDAAPLETNPTVVSDGASGQPAKYFMFIEGVDGGSAERDHRGWFEIDGYGLEVLKTVTLGGAGGGAGAGRPTFSPLSIDLGINDGLSELLAAIVRGTAIRDVRIEGIGGGERGATIFGIALRNARLVDLGEQAGDGDGLAFAYEILAIGSKTQKPDGSLGPWEAVEYNAVRNTVSNSSALLGGNDAPVLALPVGDQSSPEDAAWSFALPGGTFTDVDGDALTLTASLTDGSPLPAWLAFDAAMGTFSGTPPQDLFGAFSLKVTATDPGGLSATATFALDITPVNDGPVAGNDGGFSGTVNQAIIIPIASLLANDSDVDGDSLSIVSVDGGPHGTAALDGAGNVVFTPALNYTGVASFTYTVSDGNGGSAVATVSLTLAPNEIAGQPGQFQITGTSAPDHITVGAAHPIVSAGGGNDAITLLPGGIFQFHLLNGGAGSDTLDLSLMTAAVAVDLGLGTLSGAQAGIAVLTGIENVVGGSAGDRLIGSAGANVIEGGAGNDRLTGRGGADTFVFGAGSGADVVTDFAAGAGAGDVLRLNLGAAFDSFGEVMAAAAQSGANTVITFDAANRITLTGVANTALAADDFAFG